MFEILRSMCRYDNATKKWRDMPVGMCDKLVSIELKVKVLEQL